MTHEHQQPELLKQTPYIVAFLDFLGAEAKMCSQQDRDKFLQNIYSVYTAAANSREVKTQLEKMTRSFRQPLFCKIFSDNILIAITPEAYDSFLLAFNLVARFCSAFQFLALTKGLFIRGGITYGDFAGNDLFVFGEALVNAYKIEQHRAIYPRIVIDNCIFEQFNPYQLQHFSTNEYWGKLLRHDFDGQWYISPFGENPPHFQLQDWDRNLKDAKDAIFNEYKNSEEEKYKQKCFWLIQKFNEYCDIHKEYQYLQIPLPQCDPKIAEVNHE